LAVVGAGLIGRRHAAAIGAADGVELACIVDPSEPGRAFAGDCGVPHFATIAEMIAAGGVDGVLLATPNQLHAEGGLACIEAGLPVLIEKPLASSVEEAKRIVAAAERRRVPIATGHHRRHNPLIAKTKELIDEGRIGTIASVHGSTWFMKPEDYFDVDWRRQKGAGPVYVNLIHDVDLLLYFCGPVVEVQAMESNAVRGFEVEDTAVILLCFASGTLGTVNVCDTAVAPWSWELTARENPDYPATTQDCYWIAGDQVSLSLPNLALWSNSGKRSWWEPISATKMIFDFADPLVRQAEQFGRVVREGEKPLVTGGDGLAALTVIEAVKTSAAARTPVRLDCPGAGSPAVTSAQHNRRNLR
jgi:predicted dehydrogenase